RCHARAVACPPHDVRFLPERILLRTARIYLQLIHLLRRRRADGPISDEERAVTQRTRQAIETLRFRIHGTRAAQAVAAAYAMLGRLLVTAISVPDVGVYSNHSNQYAFFPALHNGYRVLGSVVSIVELLDLNVCAIGHV